MKKNFFYFIFLLSFVCAPLFTHAEDPNTENQPQDQPPIETPALIENVFIRNGPDVVYNGDIALPTAGNIEILDNNGVSHSVDARSVLGVLYSLDQSSESFSISNLQYYDSFSSFYLKCLNAGSSGDLCDSWQYVVGGTSPWTSIDTTILSGGESIGLYFGNPYKIELDSNSITTSGIIKAQAKSYNYVDDTWTDRSGVHIGITQVNPNDPWNPTVISTMLVDDTGTASLSFTSPGSYSVGVSEDYYYPSYSVSVSEPVSSGGSNSVSTPNVFSRENAISFLNLHKKGDGSFGGALYTDWVAVSFGSTGDSSLVSSLAEYLKSNNLTSNIVTDNERHAMALMSLGINPYDGTSVNYISKITNKFDGNQIGDVNLDNDDIFGLLVLKKAGYSYSDEIISKTIDFIKTKQYSDGSWDNSADMTSAAIMALYPFRNKDGVSDSLDKAYSYLINNQSSDGRISDNVSSTSWAVQALSLKSDLSNALAKARDYISSQQKIDGGVGDIGSDIDSRVWATSYAITSDSLKSWVDIMSDFEKPIVKTSADIKTEIIPTIVLPTVEEKNKPTVPFAEEVKKEVRKDVVKKQVKETKNIVPVLKNDAIEKTTSPKNNLVASASSASFVSKIPLITKVVWHNITTFFSSIFSFF